MSENPNEEIEIQEPTPEEVEGYEKLYDYKDSYDGISVGSFLVLAVGFVLVFFAILWGANKFMKSPPAFITDIFTDDEPAERIPLDGMAWINVEDQGEQFCIDSGYMIKGDTLLETCGAYCEAEYAIPDLVCPGCPVCPEKYTVPEHADSEQLPDYLASAEQVIQEMISISGRMESLRDLLYASENHSARLGVMGDEQFKILEDHIHTDMVDLRGRFLEMWPPPPYDSSNPLLDAHGRLLHAFLYLTVAEDYFDKAHEKRSPDLIMRYTDPQIQDMLRMIGYARVGLDLAR